jgi:hypothetical protein
VTRPAYHGPHDDAIRDLVARDLTRHEIAQEIGIGLSAVQRVLARLGITTTRAARLRAEEEGRRRGTANSAAARKQAPPNPHRTPAQQQNIERHKRLISASFGVARLPPPTREEADALIAAHIARHGITQCPPAARIDGLTWLSVTPFVGGGGGYGGLAQRRARR